MREYSDQALRSALRATGGDLHLLPIELVGSVDLDAPTWAKAHATVAGRFFAKFAFSEPTAIGIWQEARVLSLLREQLGLNVPEVVAASPDPACFATRITAGGVPLSYRLIAASDAEGIERIGDQLAQFLAKLHSPRVLALARELLGAPMRPPEPGLQATPQQLRQRLTPMIEARNRTRVLAWCDWADTRLATPCEAVFTHGDFHAYNQLWEPTDRRLLLVTDFETSGIAEPEYDFRALPAFGPDVTLLRSTAERYASLSGRKLDYERIMALHTCTWLGDALWRTEAGLPLLLPVAGGGTPDDYVDALAERLFAFGIDP